MLHAQNFLYLNYWIRSWIRYEIKCKSTDFSVCMQSMAELDDEISRVQGNIRGWGGGGGGRRAHLILSDAPRSFPRDSPMLTGLSFFEYYYTHTMPKFFGCTTSICCKLSCLCSCHALQTGSFHYPVLVLFIH